MQKIESSKYCRRSAGSPSRVFASCLVVFSVLLGTLPDKTNAGHDSGITFKRIPTQFIAALGDPTASSGGGAQTWGYWPVDPGPRGVWLKDFDKLQASDGLAPAKWQFDNASWWLDENGLIMEQPKFPIPPGKYVVTGEREKISMLTIHPADASDDRHWELDHDATLYDVTHLPCRSAVYTPVSQNSCSPMNAPQSVFPLVEGAALPAVEGCSKLDYSVLFIVGIPTEE